MYIYEYNIIFFCHTFIKNTKHSFQYSSVGSCSTLYNKIITDTEHKSSKYLREWIRPLKKTTKESTTIY